MGIFKIILSKLQTHNQHCVIIPCSMPGLQGLLTLQNWKSVPTPHPCNPPNLVPASQPSHVTLCL